MTALLHISTVGFFNEARSILDQGFSYSPDIFTATLLATVSRAEFVLHISLSGI